MRSWQGLTSVLLVSLFATMATAADSWAAPVNDDFANRLPMQLGIADTRSNAGASIEPGERLTPNDPGTFGCDKQGGEAVGGIQMNATMWWEFTGNGGPITVSTLSSTFDTVLGVYDLDTDTLVGCNDDLQPADSTRPDLEYRVASEILLDSVAGHKYAVQIGACTPPEACGTAAGNVTLRISETPANDDRANAMPIEAGNPVVTTNTGSTLEDGEVASCGKSLYGKTVWFRYTAPAAGTAVFSAAGFDTVLAVYHSGSIVPLGCNDDAVSGQSGASHLPASQPAGPPLEVAAGEYLIQVGGYYDSGFSTVAARNGPLEVQVEFTPDNDIDNDGVNAGQDCNDEDSRIHPGADEIPGNRVDENCDGKLARLPLLRTTILMLYAVGNPEDHRTRVFGFLLNDVERGAKVEIRCSGGGCRYAKRHYRIKQAQSELRLPAGFRLEPGARLTVQVTKRHAIGRGRSFLIRNRGKDPVDRKYCVDQHGHRTHC